MRTIRHFWKPAAKTKLIKTILEPFHPQLPITPLRSVHARGVLQLHGLLPIQGPSMFKPTASVVRRLTREERLDIFDVPSILHQSLLELGV